MLFKRVGRLLPVVFALLFAANVYSQVTPGTSSAPETFLNKTINSATSVTASGDTSGVKDTAAIAAILAAGNSVALASNSHYYSTGLTLDISKQSLLGNGAILDCTPMSSGSTCLTVTATVGGVNHDAQHERFTISQVDIAGNGVGTGIKFNASAEPAVAYINMVSTTVENFTACAQLGNYTYDIDLYGVTLNLCGSNGAIYAPNGVTQSFERLAMHGGAITNSVIGVNNLEAAGQVFLDGVSITFDTTFIYTANSGRVYCKNCHFETGVSSTTQSWIQAEGGAGNIITIDGGTIMADGTGPGGWPSIFDIASGSSVILSGGVLLNNLQNSATTLATGSGLLYIYPPTTTFGNANPSLTAANIVTMAALNNPTFPGNVTVTGEIISNDNTSQPSIYAVGNNPGYGYKQSGAGANAGIWDSVYSGTSLQFRAVNDAYSGSNNWLAVGRVTNNFNIASIKFGNAFDSPPYTFLGTGAFEVDSITGSTQCVHASSSGVLAGTGTDCGANYPVTAAETAASLTPVNLIYPVTNAWRYLSASQIADAIARTQTIDDQAALNHAMLAAWVNGLSLYIPGGVYKVSAALALPANTTESRGYAFNMYGDGAGDPFSAIANTNSTVIVASGTNAVLTSGPSGGTPGNGTGNYYIHDIRWECSNTTACINLTVLSDSTIERDTVLQSSTGDGVDIAWDIGSTLRDVMVMNSGKVTTGGTKTGTGINITQTGGDAGANLIAHSIVAGWNACINIGTSGDPLETTHVVDTAVQACINGVTIAVGANKTVIDTLYEENVTGTVVQDLGNATVVKDSFFFPQFTIGIDGSAVGNSGTPGLAATYSGNQMYLTNNNSFGIKTACQSWYETPCPNSALIQGNSFYFACSANTQTGIAISGASPNVSMGGNEFYPDAPLECGANTHEIVDSSTGLGVIGSSEVIGASYKYPLLSNNIARNLMIAGSSTGTTTIASANSGATNYTATLPAATGTIAITQTSSFTGTLTGYASGPTGTVNYSVNGNLCSLEVFAAITGTSNSTALTMTGVPAACQPAHAKFVPVAVEDAGVVFGSYYASVGTSGTVTFYACGVAAAPGTVGCSTASFTASGTKGLPAGAQIGPFALD